MVLLSSWLLKIFFLSVFGEVTASPLRAAYSPIVTTATGDSIFELGNITYLALTSHPRASLKERHGAEPSLVTVISVLVQHVTVDTIKATLASYAEQDDVWNEEYLREVYILTNHSQPIIEKSVFDYLLSAGAEHIHTHAAWEPLLSHESVITISELSVPPGPYLATLRNGLVSFAPVYRLYPDTYRNFLFGAYDSGEGTDTYIPLGQFLPKFWNPMIPVPSRLYSIGDNRPLAGVRVAIKDLFDIKGLQTSGGSQAWAYITPVAAETAPSIQHILDLGGVFVGKYKLAQFASGANPWGWQDEHYPFNPRGDGYLTCSASSSGGGCSIAAYDWLDFAIGSDTGSSMRRPAAVSGTYGNRPSQGIIDLGRVIPLGGATDTAGVFCRDPTRWARFAKAWYTPSLQQDPSITGLSPLSIADTDAFPRTIMYPVDYLPLNNSAAQPILEDFIANMTRIFGMEVKRFNFTKTVYGSGDPAVSLSRTQNAIGVVNSLTQYEIVGKPLTTRWAELFDGRYPPVDPAHRNWNTFNSSLYNAQTYAEALQVKNAAVQWYETNLQYSTPESCSESVMLYDIGTGGYPSYRELDLNGYPNTSFLAVTPSDAATTGAAICPLFGCADYTIPIGQTTYWSNVTYHEEVVPVTINMVVKRGCDFMLFNMVEKLADAGVLQTVKTGRTAF